MNTYIQIRREIAPKTSRNARGGISFAVLRDEAATEVFIYLLANVGGSGGINREAVPFEKIQRCLDGITTGQPVQAKAFRAAFEGRSANNGGFLAAVLRLEGLLQPAPEACHQHVLGGDWPAWKAAVLAAEGAPFVPPEASPPAPVAASPQTEAVTSDTSVERPKGKKSRKPIEGREHPTTTAEVRDAGPD